MNFNPVLIGIGALIIIACLIFYSKSRQIRLVSIVFSLVGVALLFMGIFPQWGLGAVPTRMRLSMAGASLVILYITMEAIRREHLKERYALIWVSTSIAFFGLAIYPDAIAIPAKLFGMHYSSAIMVVVFSFVLLVAFHLGIALSRYDDDKRAMSQKIAMLQRRIEELENDDFTTVDHANENMTNS